MFKFSSSSDNKKGFVLLYAVLAVTVILAVGLLLTNIITKQILLSTTGRDSQFAYYAADSMRECVFYWHIEKGAFGYIEENNFINKDYSNPVQTVPYTINCFDKDIEVNDNSGGNFELAPINITSGSKTMCVKGNITRNLTANPGEQTEIRVSGYNVDCDNTNSLRAVERTVVTRF